MVAPVPPPYGGIANWVALLDEYIKNDKDIEFVHINTAPKKRGLDGRTLWDRVVVQGFSMFKHKSNLKKIIKQEKIDAIHITTSAQLSIIRDIMLLKAAKKKNIPTAYHLRFGRVPEIAEKNTREWRMLKKAMQLATQVIAIDTSTLKAISKHAPEVNVCYIPNPFNLKKFESALKTEKSECKKEIVFIGWVTKTKGIEELLEAWEKTQGELDDWKLRIVGPYANDYYVELKNRFKFDNVIFDGEKGHDEAMEILSSAGAFILPSYTEGFPNAVLEAMAFGKAIIATDVGAIPDMLLNCGIVIPSRNSEAVSDALIKLLKNSDLISELGQLAREKMENEYTIEKVFESYKKVWNGTYKSN